MNRNTLSTQNKYQGVIFDLDGTLLNTIADLTSGVNYALGKLNYKQRTVEEVTNFVGSGIRITLERALGSTNDLEEAIMFFTEYYRSHLFDETVPYSGIVELLKTLKRNNYKIAVVSNKSEYAVSMLCDHFFFSLVDACVGYVEGRARKPNPEMINLAIKKINYEKNKFLYVGDSDVDIMTSKNVRVDLVSVSWGFQDKEWLKKQGAKNIISKPSELLKYLEITG